MRMIKTILIIIVTIAITMYFTNPVMFNTMATAINKDIAAAKNSAPIMNSVGAVKTLANQYSFNQKKQADELSVD